MHQASVGFHCPECAKAGSQRVYQGVASLQARPLVTQVIIAVNVLAFAAVVVSGGLDALWGATTQIHVDFALIAKFFNRVGTEFPGGVGDGQWYRLVTSGFLHYGVFHIGFNMYVLYILGPVLERGAGRLRFGLIYFVSLLAGSLGALLVSPESLTAGASGAIFGLMGALVLAYRSMGVRIQDSPVFGILVLNLVITFLLPGISAGGHIGGLVGGLVTGWLFFDLGRQQGMDKRVPVALAVALGIACVAVSVAVATGYQPV